jgi:serine/threonine protein kinase
MTDLQDYVGQVLDEKYRLERLLGQGGMGAVYLATHLGTERYVALKLITPQFMSNKEFVERFKREARAAGRLRHPNVVDVTDFGFAEARGETVAYLVMEYLDGCTLGDVLREEHRLPLEWVVDILEQVCSAVHEAHQQGIVHRDLKPENIWLEPNRLGGYRVKVLDFGIAKLGQANAAENNDSGFSGETHPTKASATQTASSAKATHLSPSIGESTAMLGAQGTNATNATGVARSLEADTILYADSIDDEFADDLSDADSHASSEVVETQIFGRAGTPGDPETGRWEDGLTGARSQKHQAAPGHAVGDDEGDGTLLFDQATRPFVASLHTASQVATTAELTRIGAIMGTPVYMSPEQCSGKSSDGRSDIYSLGVITYQMLAGEPPFTGETSKIMREHIEVAPVPLRVRLKVPERVANIVMSALSKRPEDRPQTARAFASSLRAQAEGIGSLYRRAFALYSEYFPKFLKLSVIAHIPVIITTVPMVVLHIAEQAQPRGMGVARVSLIVALVIFTLLQVVAYFLAASVISGMTAIIVTQVSAAPLRPVELRTAFAVMKKRWRPFLRTSVRVTLRILLGYLLLCIGGLVMTARYALYAPVVLMEGLEKKAAMKRARELASRSWRTVIIITLLQFAIPVTVSALLGSFSAGVHGPSSGLRASFEPLKGLANIVILPLISIVPALLYLKMRQLGGETLSAVLSQIDDVDTKHSAWRQRMRSRVTLPTARSRP